MTDLEDETDAQLVAKTMRGDDISLTVLFHRHESRVRSIVQTMVRGDEAKDIASIAMTKAWTALLAKPPKFDTKQLFAPWLNTIALNCAMDHLRKRKRLPRTFSINADDTGDAWQQETIPTGGGPKRKRAGAKPKSRAGFWVLSPRAKYWLARCYSGQQINLLEVSNREAFHEKLMGADRLSLESRLAPWTTKAGVLLDGAAAARKDKAMVERNWARYLGVSRTAARRHIEYMKDPAFLRSYLYVPLAPGGRPAPGYILAELQNQLMVRRGLGRFRVPSFQFRAPLQDMDEVEALDWSQIGLPVLGPRKP